MRLAVSLVLMVAALASCRMADEAKGKSIATNALNDPASAKFRHVRSKRDEAGGVTVCGEVNAKNALGGYVGFRRFMVNLSSEEVLFDPGQVPVEELNVWNASNAYDGISFSLMWTVRCPALVK